MFLTIFATELTIKDIVHGERVVPVILQVAKVDPPPPLSLSNIR